jgi:glycosyltransferase involved in cell wall biosynthesis
LYPTIPLWIGWRCPRGLHELRGRDRNEVQELLDEADLFVFPTRQDYMPQVLAEALTAGVPYMASDIGGVRDLVRNGETGYLMPYHASLEEWARIVTKLRDHPHGLDYLSRRSREFAEQQLAGARFAALVNTTVDDLLDLRGTKNRVSTSIKASRP